MGIFNQDIEKASYQGLVSPESAFMKEWVKCHGHKTETFTFDGFRIFCTNPRSSLFIRGSMDLAKYLPTAKKLSSYGQVILAGHNNRQFDMQNIIAICSALIEINDIRNISDVILTTPRVRLNKVDCSDNVFFDRVDYIDVLHGFTKFQNCKFYRVGSLMFKESITDEDEFDFAVDIKKWILQSQVSLKPFERVTGSYWFPDANKYSVSEMFGLPCQGVSVIKIWIDLFSRGNLVVRFEQDPPSQPYPGSITSDGFAVSAHIE